MDPTTRLKRVGADVTSTITAAGIPFSGDFGQKFNSDLKISSLGAFQQLLDRIEAAINADALLPKLHPFHWNAVHGFSQYYYSRSVNNLVWAIDGMISHAPVIA